MVRWMLAASTNTARVKPCCPTNLFIRVPTMSDQDYYVVYKITNLINGKIYVGYQKNGKVDDRYRGSGIAIEKAVNKYGIENFSKEILYVFETEKEATDKEEEIVDEEFVARSDNYNLKPGGYGGWDYVNSLKLWDDPKRCENQSMAMKNYWDDSEKRENQSITMKKVWADPNNHDKFYGVRESSEFKEKVSDAMKDLWSDPDYYKKQINTRQTEESRHKHSVASKKMWQDPEYIEKQNILKSSDEYRKKQSESLKKAWADPEKRRKQSESHKGKIKIYSPDQDIETSISKHDPIPNGFKRGRRPR